MFGSPEAAAVVEADKRMLLQVVALVWPYDYEIPEACWDCEGEGSSDCDHCGATDVECDRCEGTGRRFANDDQKEDWERWCSDRSRADLAYPFQSIIEEEIKDGGEE